MDIVLKKYLSPYLCYMSMWLGSNWYPLNLVKENRDITDPEYFVMSIVFRNLRERFAAPAAPIVIDDDDEDINDDNVNQGLYTKISSRV